MWYRIASLAILSSALACLAGTASAGTKNVQAAANAPAMSHEGTVVSVAAGKLTMTDKSGGKEHSHDVGPTATITVDGKPAKLEALKKGAIVTVTTDAGGKVVSVAAVSAKAGAK